VSVRNYNDAIIGGAPAGGDAAIASVDIGITKGVGSIRKGEHQDGKR
jgi:alkyl hydroperoxide reductase subunit AhpF